MKTCTVQFADALRKRIEDSQIVDRAPDGFWGLNAGSLVLVHGLRAAAAAKYNGKRGCILRHDKAKGRFVVQLEVRLPF